MSHRLFSIQIRSGITNSITSGLIQCARRKCSSVQEELFIIHKETNVKLSLVVERIQRPSMVVIVVDLF